MDYRRRGLSLLELILVVAIFGMVAATGFVAVRRGHHTTGSKGMADVLADELRAARTLALSSRDPVGVLFPRGGLNCCRGFYLAQGREAGRLVRGRNLGKEYGQASLFLGDWPSTLGAFDITDVDVGTADDNARLSLASWVPASHSTDSALIFLPSGRVRNHNFAHIGGHYVIVAGQGFQVSGTTLQGADEPYSVVVSPLGAVHVEKGVFSSSANLATRGAPPQPGTPLQPMAGPGNNAPSITNVTVFPEANESVHGADEYSVSDIIVDLYPDKAGTPDNSRDFATVSLRIYATDPDAQQLRYRWRETTADSGRFSAPSGVMEWLGPPINRWAAWCDWTPPIDAPNTTTYRFDCQITDPEGNTVGSEASGTIIRVQPRTPGKIAFEKYSWDDTVTGDTDAIYVMNIDGTAIRQIANQANINEGAPDWSPAGDWLAMHSLNNSGVSDIVMTSADGKSRINLTASPTIDDIYPRWSPRGDRIANYSDEDGDGVYGVIIREAQNGGARQLIASDQNVCPLYPCSFSPTGDYVSYLRDPGSGPTSLHVKRVTALSSDPSMERLGPGRGAGLNGFDIEYAKWNPTYRNRMLAVTWGGKLLLIELDPDQPESAALNSSVPIDLCTLGLGFSDAWDAEWSPDGKHIAVCSASPNYDLYLVKDAWEAGRTCGRLTSGQDTMCPVFSPDGRWLVVQQWQDKVRGAPPTAVSAYKLFRRPADSLPGDPDNSQMRLLSEDSSDVSGHSVSR